MSKLQAAAAVATIIGVIIAALALIPAFGQWLSPRSPEAAQPPTLTAPGASTETPLAPSTAAPGAQPPEQIPAAGVYDDFGQAQFDGQYNSDLWNLWLGTPDRIVQNNGQLQLTAPPPAGGETGLYLKKHPARKLSQRSYFEARLKLSREAYAGNIGLKIFAYHSNGDWSTQCVLEGSEGEPYVTCGAEHQYTDRKPIELDTWHTVGIEIEADAARLNYYIDGVLAGSLQPGAPAQLRQATWSTAIGAWSRAGLPVVGYVDEVRVSLPADQ